MYQHIVGILRREALTVTQSMKKKRGGDMCENDKNSTKGNHN